MSFRLFHFFNGTIDGLSNITEYWYLLSLGQIDQISAPAIIVFDSGCRKLIPNKQMKLNIN